MSSAISPSRVLDAKHVLLTGATGVLGSRLLKELLETTDVSVDCLVRGEDEAHARTRLHGIFAVYDPDGALSGAFRDRVRVHAGDVTREFLGLPSGEYGALAARVDATIHMAALTKLVTFYGASASANVDGTAHVIDFALRTPRRSLCYISTIGVFGDRIFDAACTFRESDFDLGQGFRGLPYQETKFRAEAAVRNASRRGLVWNICRLGYVFGEAATGRYPLSSASVDGLFYNIIKTVCETGVAPGLAGHFDVTPVDYASRAIAFLALARGSSLETYHLLNPDRKTYRAVFELVRGFGYPLVIVSGEAYRELVFGRRLLKDGKPYDSPMLRSLKFWYAHQVDYGRSADIDSAYTRGLLEREAIVCPAIDAGLLAAYLDYAVRERYLPAPASAASVSD